MKTKLAEDGCVKKPSGDRGKLNFVRSNVEISTEKFYLGGRRKGQR
jgi:hypothetical protein